MSDSESYSMDSPTDESDFEPNSDASEEGANLHGRTNTDDDDDDEPNVPLDSDTDEEDEDIAKPPPSQPRIKPSIAQRSVSKTKQHSVIKSNGPLYSDTDEEEEEEDIAKPPPSQPRIKPSVVQRSVSKTKQHSTVKSSRPAKSKFGGSVVSSRESSQRVKKPSPAQLRANETQAIFEEAEVTDVNEENREEGAKPAEPV